MISCTEFIPAYSELFSFLDEKYGREEVERFWTYLFKPNGVGIPLINFLNKEGIKGCYSYWSGSLNEEAADFSMYLNEKDGWFKIDMHRCPSKGRLLELEDEIGIKPYPDYCRHCDHYRESVEQVGLEYIYDFCGTDQAACSLFVYDPKKFPKKLVVDENTLQMHRSAADNEYFHRDFHSSMNNGIQYLGEMYGEQTVRDFLVRFTNNVYRKVIEKIQSKGIAAIEEKIVDTYEKEKCAEVLKITKEGNKTTFEVEYCPAVKHLTETGRTVTEWFELTTSVVMQSLAEHADLCFEMEEYDASTGKARYSFY